MAQDGEGLNGGYIPHLQGMKTSKCGHSGSCRKAPGWGELEIAVAGEHTGPLTSSLSRKQREGTQCASSPLLRPPAPPPRHPSLKCAERRGCTKFWIFFRSRERRGRWAGRGKKLTPKQLGEGRMVHAGGKDAGCCRKRAPTHPVTEAWWGHSGLGHDSAGIALRSLHWPEWECCSQGVGVAGWGCFLVLGTHLQKSQVFLVLFQ